MRFWVFGVMVSVMAPIAACSSTATTSGSGGSGGATTGSDTTTTATTGTNPTTSTSTTTGTSASTGTGGGACADATDCKVCPTSSPDNACATCCDKATPKGYAAYKSLFVKNCACPATSKCHTECGMNGADPDFCADMTKEPSPTCIACLNSVSVKPADACLGTFSAECPTNADCAAFAMCTSTCAG